MVNWRLKEVEKRLQASVTSFKVVHLLPEIVVCLSPSHLLELELEACKMRLLIRLKINEV